MSTKPYDFLASDKEPFLYLEKTKLCMDDGFLTAFAADAGVFPIAPASHLLLLLGHGTSITQEAACFAAKHDLQIAFVRGGNNVHSFFMDGRYQSPAGLIHQVKLLDNRLAIAKALLHYRYTQTNQEFDEDYLTSLPDVQSVIAYEGRLAKKEYIKFCLQYKKPNFKRDFNSSDSINEKLNVLNNSLYSFCTAICLSCGCNPSVGYLHGMTRRGGLAFDLADLFKHKITLPLAFSSRVKNSRQGMYELHKALKANNFAVVKTLIKFCLYFSGVINEVEGMDVSRYTQQVQGQTVSSNETDNLLSATVY